MLEKQFFIYILNFKIYSVLNHFLWQQFIFYGRQKNESFIHSKKILKHIALSVNKIVQ